MLCDVYHECLFFEQVLGFLRTNSRCEANIGQNDFKILFSASIGQRNNETELRLAKVLVLKRFIVEDPQHVLELHKSFN